MKKNVFTNLSIRKKLPLIVVATCLSALLLAGIAFLANQRRDTRAALVEHASTIAKVIASRSTAAIIFDDKKTAAENLAVLSLLPQVDEAGIFLTDSSLFASYIKQGHHEHWPQQISLTYSYTFNTDGFGLYEPINLDGKQLGMVYIQTNLAQYNHKLLEQSSIAVLITIITLFMAFLLSRRALKNISQPIAELAALTRHVAERNDYTVRAPAQSSQDEIGCLVDDFNNMLVQIEKRDFALQESKNRFRTLLDQAGDAFFLHDSDGRFIEVNERACDSLGYTREELLRMSVFDIDADTLKESPKETVWDTLVPGHPQTLYGTHLRKDGTTFPVEVRIVLVEEGNKRYMQGLARDISDRQQAETEKEKLETQLRQGQKMEAIGTLAGGIAHDFNNLLSPIIGYSELILLERIANSTVTKQIQEILTAANRAKELVKQILTFSRRSEHKLAPLMVQPVIKEALQLLRSSIPSSIEIQQNINPEGGAVLADPVQIHQIIMNLCTNAYQAITSQSGIISVSLTPVILAQADIASKVGLQPGHYLKLVVEDSGEGIDPESLKRIFEPYFTTKEKGKGTGLGLAVVHGIVKNYGGEINVYSEPGKGTRFNIYLPVVSKETPQEKESLEKPLQTGTEKLLLVDDEAQITQLGQIFLETLGYQVTSCNDPAEALSLFSNEPNRFDLVITDMTMPKMTGALLSQKLLTVRKDLPIIMCTGFSETMDEETAKQFGIRAFLMKPVSSHDLAAAIRAVLDTK
ncbi:MAG: PAS domain S-box protein [Deltaproteobacteria bacterium]|nr:PAS domain S-box protein [Deltaproteobacteria bacterium]